MVILLTEMWKSMEAFLLNLIAKEMMKTFTKEYTASTGKFGTVVLKIIAAIEKLRILRYCRKK